MNIDRLVVLNVTGKIVWDLYGGGLAQQEIATAVARLFGIPAEAALATITTGIDGLKEAGFLARPAGEAGERRCAQNPLANGEAIEPDPDVDCDTFQFGARRVRIHSNLANIGS